MNILMIALEAAPYLKTSDVAHVITGLSTALRRKGHDVRIVMPKYRNMAIDASGALAPPSAYRPITEFPVRLGMYSRQASLSCLHDANVASQPPVYLIENDFYFGRDNPHGYLDDYERAIFFNRAVIEMLDNEAFRAESWVPEILHGHDWIAGLLPMCLRHTYKEQPASSTTFVYTIHNAGFPGEFGYRAIRLAELDELGIYDAIGETTNRINFMARGMLAADAVNTVSPRYAEEIRKAENVYEELAVSLKLSGKTIKGILNGFDYSAYNPAFDDNIASKFNEDTLEHKRGENKLALQRACGLKVDAQTPLLGMISRLIADKGIGLLEEIIPSLVELDIQVVIAGIVTDYHYREALTRFQDMYPTHIAPVFTSPDDPFVRMVLAGCDIMLVPSIREPCGSQQMAAMRYGAIPLVRRTGGLVDTIVPWDSAINAREGKGFLFDAPSSAALLQSIREAVELYRSHAQEWLELQLHDMQVRFSWNEAAQEYVRLYQDALLAHQEHRPLERGVVSLLDQSSLLVQAILEVSELATTIIDEQQYLVQVASGIRELLKHDAVLIWKLDDADPQRLMPYGYSFQAHEDVPLPEFDAYSYRIFSEQDSRSWQFIYGLNMQGEALPPASVGFLNNQLAHRRKWASQLSVPMNTHDLFLGKIDVFSCEVNYAFGREKETLQAFASAVAVSLEKARASREAEKLLTADREMARAQTVYEIAEVMLRHAKSLTHADVGYLQLSIGRSYSLDMRSHFKELAIREATETQSEQDSLESALSESINLFDDDARPTKNAMRLRAEHRSHISREIIDGREEDIGTIVMLKSQPVAFSKDEERVLCLLANQAANVLRSAYLREKEDQSRVSQLRTLADSLVGGGDLDTLLQKVVSTTADVLQAEAASLYLIDEKTKKLVIRAAHGYHKKLLTSKNVAYDIGEGTTGWIAEQGKTFKADSLEELHRIPQWRGKHKELQGGREPSVFLGIPFKVTEPDTQQERVIGVLKLEDRLPQRPFTDQDERLGEMMANVIATVIQNTRLSDTSLQELNADLQKLSAVMAGGLDMDVLLTRIVDTITEVVGADASSLYLIEPGTSMLTIQAATGYQSGLVAKGAKYELQRDKGLTAWIARSGQSFTARSTEELHRHSAWVGKHTTDQGGREPNAFLGIPLKVIAAGGDEEIIGVLKVEDIRPSPRHPEPYFTEQSRVLVEMMGNVIATVIQNTRLNDIRLRELNINLQTLSSVMVGGLEMDVLVQRIVDTIATVLGADASSLYLKESGTSILMIQAATGYQSGLVAKGAKYDWQRDKGLTAWIARSGQSFTARSTEELHRHAEWEGKHTSDQGGREPNAFLGIPLKVIVEGASEEIIGVLKVEDIRPSPRHPESYFTEQDRVVVEMMGNVITTVIQNTRLNDIRLREMNINLQTLSTVMVGGLEMRVLVQRIVDTIATVLGADASSLYLREPGTSILMIQAATGYQSGLVAKGARYDQQKDKGLTVWIARTGQPVTARSTEELHRHAEWAGKHTADQGGREPNAFLGMPLKFIGAGGSEEVIGVLKVEDIRPGPRHPEPYFTEQDQVLVEMMGNVITTVIQNMRLSDADLEKLLAHAFSLCLPLRKDDYEILHPFVGHSNEVVLKAVSSKLLESITGVDVSSMEEQTSLLLHLGANPELFRVLYRQSGDEIVKRWYGTLYDLCQTADSDLKHVVEALRMEPAWQEAVDATKRMMPEKSHKIAETLAMTIAKSAMGEAIWMDEAGRWVVFKMRNVLSGSNMRVPEDLLMLFFLGSEWHAQEDMENLRSFLSRVQQEINNIVSVVSCLQEADTRKFTQDLRRELEAQAIDCISFTLKNMQSIVCARQPQEQLLRRLLQEINLVTISPYNISGPTPTDMFFGREREEREITNQLRSFSHAIIGGRRVGKSSLLQRLHLVLPGKGYNTIYHDCSNTPTYEKFLASHIINWQPAQGAIKGAINRAPTTFGELLQLPSPGRPLVLLLDESDKLIPADSAANWPFFNALRAAVNQKQLQIILSGERSLRYALHDDHSPLFNFVNETILGPLDYLAVGKLVTRPMQSMGIVLLDEKTIVKHIWDFTSGHPNVVQRLCARLVVQLNKENAREIDLNMVNRVIEDPKFQEEDFLETYLAQASGLERGIVYLMVLHNQKQYRLQAIIDLLAAHDLLYAGDVIKKALDRLTLLRSILRQGQAGYEFAVKAFSRVLADKVTVEDMLIQLKSEYRKDPDDLLETDL